MKQSKQQILDLLLHTAQGFYDVGRNCAINVTKDNEITGVQRLASGAVNLTFAAELILKGLYLYINKKSIRGHHINSLYHELPTDLRTNIEERYNHHEGLTKDSKELGAFSMKVSKATDNEQRVNKETNSLLVFLKTHNTGFEDWRYLYELGDEGYTYDIDFRLMDCFIKAIIDTMNSLPIKKRLYLTKANEEATIGEE